MTENPIETFCPTNPEDWRQWLEINHLSKTSIWLVIYKKSTPNPNLSWSQAVDEALCYGWIDSTKRSIDQDSYMQYFCKRKPKSIWSKINKKKVDELLEKGLIKEAGLKSIAIAKENGSWNILDSVEALIIPKDLKLELTKSPVAFEYFNTLSDSIKKQLLYWVISAKRPETRQKRIVEITENTSEKRLPKHIR